MLLNETQIAIQNAVGDFARARIAPRSRTFEAAGGYPDGLFQEVAGQGLFGMTAPEDYGALALIELAAADGALSTIVSIQNSLLVSGILKDGTDEQNARYLPDLIAGRMIGAFALTEADAGSDAAAIRTRAEPVDGGYLLNGAKQFITSGKIAGVALVIAVTDPLAGKRGMSAFLIPANTPGYSVDKVEHKMGQGASDRAAIRFTDLFVPESARLGAEGEGYRVALSNLETGRIGIAAQCVGMARAAFDIAVAYAKDRKSFGQPIIAHQAVGFRPADMATRLEAARQLVLHAACLKDAGRPCLSEASMAKLFASETAETVCSGAIQTFGGYGYLEDFGLAKIYRDVRVCQIYEGASDIQRMVIARSL
jgi:alkylation response protein AidB-like acyl-CoA dehydrogenase